MNAGSYVAPVTAEQTEALKSLSSEEVKWLEQVFTNPIFIKALRRANLAKPTTSSSGKDPIGDVRKLATIRGWELYEKALLVSHKKEELESMMPPLEEEYLSEEEQ